MTVPDTIQVAPMCATCGERVVSNVTAPAPKFVGLVRGPCAEFKALDPAVVNLRKEIR